jgi:(R,R)-butanediol dehydrogenase/meso-butanediol dehydrogenase/diacetyl reductase
MRGLQYYGANDIRYNTEIPVPTVTKPDDVVVKVAFCGICGTDLHEFEEPIFFANAATEQGDKISGKKLPLVLGHEFSGVVHAIGSNVTHLQPGDHVVVETTGHCEERRNYFTEPENKRRDLPTCQSCDLGYTNTCTDLNFLGLGVDNGALAEFTKYSKDHVLKVDKKIPLDVCALIEPLSVVWHAVELAGFKEGQDALVLGAGPIGLATLLVLQAKGASKVVVSEPASIRREQAEKLGAVGFNPAEFGDKATEELRKLGSRGQGFAASFDCSGIPVTYATSIHALRARGVACNVAIWPHKSVAHYVMDLTLEEKSSVGSLGYTTKDFAGVIGAMESGDLDFEKVKNLITGKVSLKDGVEKGFKELMAHKDKHIKVLISPQE